MEHIQQPSWKHLITFLGFSLGVHVCSLVILGTLNPRQSDQTVPQRVAINVVEKPKPKPIEAAPEPKQPPVAPVEAKAERSPTKPKPKPTTTRTTPQAAPQPVLGLNPDSFSKDGSGSFSAPMGNTTDTKDEGKRLSPEDIKGLAKDLSQDAELLVSSFVRPPYTPEAEDAGLEGSFVIEVYVDATGQVTEAELPNKIGYGMDVRVLDAARKAKFRPRKDPLGRVVPGWTQIRIRLTLD
jgi:protein TonB